MNFIEKTNDVAFSTDLCVKDNVQVSSCGSLWGCRSVGWVIRIVNDRMM